MAVMAVLGWLIVTSCLPASVFAVPFTPPQAARKEARPDERSAPAPTRPTKWRRECGSSSNRLTAFSMGSSGMRVLLGDDKRVMGIPGEQDLAARADRGRL